MNTILFWNEVALQANLLSHSNGKEEQTGPTLSSRALAIVHLAMYDAYMSVHFAGGGAPPDRQPYLPGLPAPPASATTSAAVAGAAHTTLSALFPSQKGYFDTKLAEAAGVAGFGDGTAYGHAVGQAMLKDRKDDPKADSAGYTPSMERGHHRPDPDSTGQPFHGAFYGKGAKCFATHDPNRHPLNAPPPLGSAAYKTALKQVRGLGIAPELMGTVPSGIKKRNIDQTIAGIYWGYDGAAGLGTPPRLYNQIIRKIAESRGESEERCARLFALANVAMGDAGILAWEQKYKHDLWRPVVGIREHDPSMGPASGPTADNVNNDCDTEWRPLGAPATNSVNVSVQSDKTPGYPFNQSLSGRMKNFTPPFPAYPSGHATFGAAAFHITRLFYGVPANNHDSDDLFDGLHFVSDEYNGSNQDNRGTTRPLHRRKFENGGLWQMIEENGRSRVYLGVHWVFDAFAVDEDDKMDLSQNVGGVAQGLAIAEDIFANGMAKSAVGPLP